MYTNNKDCNSKRQTRTKLTDMGVVVIDEEHSSFEINGKSEPEQQSNQDEATQLLLNEGDAPLDMTLVTVKEKRSRFKRVLIAGGVTVGLFCLLFGAVYLWLSSGSRQSEEHKVSANNSSSNKVNEQPQGITEEEISKELNKHKTDGDNQATQTPTNPSDGSSPDNSPITDRLPNEDLSATVNSNDAENRNVNDVAANSSSQSASSSYKAVSNTASANNSSSTVSLLQNNSSFVPTHSICVGSLQSEKEKKDERTSQSSSSTETTNTNQTTTDRNQTNEDSENRTTRKNNVSVALPPFGTILPVRTVGTVFTLRSDSYVRLQLTRDVSGQGWALKRGTEFYGTVKSADIETGRAFISIVGFVDPNTNRFVRLSASVMGGDGADGVRGKKHKLNSSWVNALKKVGTEILDTAKSASTGIGRRPIIINETSPRIADPIAEEIGGLIVNKNGFVEVPAGTACYVSVTTLPNETQGVDTDVSLPDKNVPKAKQLSEQEIAELLTNGNKDEIRLALPRMSPQMRRVAEAFLVNK